MAKSRLALVAVIVAVLCVGSGQCTPESRVPDAGKAGVAVANNSSSAIAEFHVVASSSKATDWGPNLLAAPIPPGGQRTVAELAAGDYDVLLVAAASGAKADPNYETLNVPFTGNVNYEFKFTGQKLTLSSDQPLPTSGDFYVGYWSANVNPIVHVHFKPIINSYGMGPKEYCEGACGSFTCGAWGGWWFDLGANPRGGLCWDGQSNSILYFIDQNTIGLETVGSGHLLSTFRRVKCP